MSGGTVNELITDVDEAISKLHLFKSRLINGNDESMAWSFFDIPCIGWKDEISQEIVHVYHLPIHMDDPNEPEHYIIIINGASHLYYHLQDTCNFLRDNIWEINEMSGTTVSQINSYKKPILARMKNAKKIQTLLKQTHVTNDGRSFNVSHSYLCRSCGKSQYLDTCTDCHGPIQPHGYIIVTDDKLTSKFMKVFKYCCHFLTDEEFLKMTNRIFNENTDI